MRASDADRRALAQALRSLSNGSGAEIYEFAMHQSDDTLGYLTLLGTAVVAAMDDSVGFLGDSNVSGYLSALADFVDAEGAGTCRNLSPKPADDEQEQPPVYTDWLFKCSYCGWDGQIWKSVGHDDMSLCETNYCPNCGEAVLE